MTEAAGRDHAGKFAAGNPGGPGRPARVTEAAYLRALAEAVPPETWREIVARAVADAQAGDAKAREWLGRYLLPDPAGGGLAALAELDRADRLRASVLALLGVTEAEAEAGITVQMIQAARDDTLLGWGASAPAWVLDLVRGAGYAKAGKHAGTSK